MTSELLLVWWAGAVVSLIILAIVTPYIFGSKMTNTDFVACLLWPITLPALSLLLFVCLIVVAYKKYRGTL